jgi:hypothetical protein
MTIEMQQYITDQTFTKGQQTILDLVAEGHTLSSAAPALGIHRNTVRNWRRADPAFDRDMELAIQEQAQIGQEQIRTLAAAVPQNGSRCGRENRTGLTPAGATGRAIKNYWSAPRK